MAVVAWALFRPFAAIRRGRLGTLSRFAVGGFLVFHVIFTLELEMREYVGLPRGLVNARYFNVQADVSGVTSMLVGRHNDSSNL